MKDNDVVRRGHAMQCYAMLIDRQNREVSGQ